MQLAPHVIKLLSEKEQSKELADLRQRLQGLVSMSRSVMKDYYNMWDMNDAVYRGERKPDEADRKAAKRNEPGKVYLPLTHSQVQTFVSFATMVLTQRDFFYELGASGKEDVKPAKLGQACLQRDINYNKFQGVLLPQFLTDVARFGIGIVKSQWRRVTIPVATQQPDPKWQPDPAMPNATQPPMVTVWSEKTKYLGNMIEVVSPYRWFPDTRLPITRFRDGEFCADEREYAFSELNKMQAQGECAGVDNIPRLPDDTYADRRLNIMSPGTGTNASYDPRMSPKDAAAYCVITEVEYRCNPSKLLIGPDTYLDPTLDAEIVVLIWIANDGRIIRIKDAGYEHNEFLYDAGQFFNDQNRVINFGIAELLGPMQDVLDWLMNARVTNVRKVMNNQVVVDPRNIELQDLKDRNPVIRLKSTVPEGMAISNYIQQLQVTDVTTGHITDMGIVKNFSEDATGMTENLLGQYAEGRRSARESSNVNANASARVILPIRGLWEMALEPLGRKLLCNLQQGLDEAQLVSIIGLQQYIVDSQPELLMTPQGMPIPSVSPVQAFLPVDKTMLVGSYDFTLFDATLPSQRMARAAALAQAGDTLTKNPLAIFALNKDPKLLFESWMEDMGIRNVQQYDLTPERAQLLMQLAGAARNAGGAQGAPGQSQAGGPPN